MAIKSRIIHVQELDVEKYNYIKKIDDLSTPFHNLAWLKAISYSNQSYKLKFVEYSDNDEIIGYLPIFSKYLGFLCVSSLWGGYGGVISQSKSLNFKLPHLSLSRIFSYRDIRYSSLIRKEKTMTTWVTDISVSYDELFKSLHSKTRNQIRKAEKSNLIYDYVESEEQVLECYAIYQRLVEKHNIEKPLSKNTFSALVGKNKIDFIAAFHNQKIIAYSVFLYSSTECFYWLNASDHDYSNLNATNGILNFVINKITDETQLDRLNFGAVPLGNTGLQHFKDRWGASALNYKMVTSFTL